MSGENPLVRMENELEALGLPQMRLGVGGAIDAINAGARSPVEALSDLVDSEWRQRQAKAIAVCVSTAHLPFAKTFDDFDFSFQPSLNRAEVLDLQYLRFMEGAENVIFIGSPGVGKTHLASAVAMCSARQRKATYFITCQELVSRLQRAELQGKTQQVLSQYARYGLLVIDEVGFLPLGRDGAKLFFQLISMRYERHSTIVTTNVPLSRWSETFEDPVLTNAILDRLLHHSRVFKIVGRSYRTKDIAGLAPAADPLGGQREREDSSARSTTPCRST
jgi:DNA replication protein DnaC